MAYFREFVVGSVVALSSGAQAADLPAKAAAPVEYVRVCSVYGTGFFYVPGTTSCLRISGRVRAEILYGEPFNRANDAFGFRARGRVNIDHRTSTDYGLLRTYIRYEITRSSGTPYGAQGGFSTNPQPKQAFIQFGGLTAGRVTSFFTDPDLPAPNFGDLRFDDPANADVDVFAYTYSFGNGFSATLSLENGLQRRVNNTLVFPLFGVDAAVPVFAPIPFTYGGDRSPDVVANLRYTSDWGGVQLSGALHQIRDVAAGLTTVDGVIVPVLNPINGLPNPTFADTDYGFAAALNFYAKVPFLGAADTAWVSATYTDGAVGYINAGQSDPDRPARQRQRRHRRRSARPALRGRLRRSVHGRLQDEQGLRHRRRPQPLLDVRVADQRLRLVDALRRAGARALPRARERRNRRRRDGRNGHRLRRLQRVPRRRQHHLVAGDRIHHRRRGPLHARRSAADASRFRSRMSPASRWARSSRRAPTTSGKAACASSATSDDRIITASFRARKEPAQPAPTMHV